MLRREMGIVHATAMVVGIIIGASIFVQPSEVSRHVASVSAVYAVWIAAGLLTLTGALVCAELARMYPESGGVYAFLRQTISPAVAFLWGWAMFWVMHTGIVAAIAVVAARYVGFFVPLSESGTRLVAAVAVLLLSAVNYLGVRAGSGLQAVLTIAKLAAIAAILVAVAVLSHSHAAPAGTPAASSGLQGFLLAVSAGLFAFGGWHMVTYTAGETRDASRTIPRALTAGVLIVTACYLGLNAAYLRVLPLQRVFTSTRVAADAAQVLVGARGAAFISGLVVLSALGALNGVILAGPRVYYAMAADKLAPAWMGRVHEQFRTPHVSIALQAVWACVLVATASYRGLYTSVVYTEWVFFALLAVGLMRQQRRLRVAPALFALACALVVANQIASDVKSSAVGLMFVAAGVPVFYWMKHRSAILNRP